MNVPGWLAVGTQYCTQRGECTVVGEDLGAVPLGDGRTALPAIGCRLNPEYPSCVSGRVQVHLLARSPHSSVVIVRLNDRNYAVGSPEWAVEKPDGSAVGGPIMIEAHGELIPLHYFLRGMTRQARQASLQKIDARRKAALANILSVKRRRCDQLISVTKSGEGSFTATCTVKGHEKQYEESVSGLE